MQESYLTHKAATDAPDYDTMHLEGMDDKTATVFFDGDPDTASDMSLHTYDKLTQGDDWEEVGFQRVN